VNINEFSSGAPAVKFAAIGDGVAGTITEAPELVPDKYANDGNGQVLVLVLSTDDGERTLYARKQQLGTIGDAVRESDVDEIDVGGFLEIRYVADRPTGGLHPMKVYSASYIAPSALGTATFGAQA